MAFPLRKSIMAWWCRRELIRNAAQGCGSDTMRLPAGKTTSAPLTAPPNQGSGMLALDQSSDPLLTE